MTTSTARRRQPTFTRYELYIMPRSDHRLTPRAVDAIADWLRLWLCESAR